MFSVKNTLLHRLVSDNGRHHCHQHCNQPHLHLQVRTSLQGYVPKPDQPQRSRSSPLLWSSSVRSWATNIYVWGPGQHWETNSFILSSSLPVWADYWSDFWWGQQSGVCHPPILLQLYVTVISRLLSAPEYKTHPRNLQKIIILNINKPHMSISRRCLPVHWNKWTLHRLKLISKVIQ